MVSNLASASEFRIYSDFDVSAKTYGKTSALAPSATTDAAKAASDSATYFGTGNTTADISSSEQTLHFSVSSATVTIDFSQKATLASALAADKLV